MRLDGTYYGRTSAPAAPVEVHDPNCTRCGSKLAGRLERVKREHTCTTWIWRCGCGRRRRLRREAVGAM